MANLTARFQMIDEMSQKMANLAAGGQTMLDKWESAGDAASAAMDAISSSASYAATAADGVATSIDSIEQAVSGADSAAGDLADVLDQYGAAADEAAQKTSYWTSAVGGYDKAMMEATYSTQELVDMGVKSTAALDDLNDMMSLCEKSSDNLSKSVEASAGIHDALTASIKKTDDQLDELMQNEKLSTDTKKELAQAQLEADAAMQNYQAVMQSGTEDLGKLEAAAEQVGHASESLAAANGKASDATDELAKTTQKASDEADKASKTGTEAVTTIAQALAAAGITATIKEITSAVYDMTNAYSDAEKIIVNATGATGDALDGLGASALKAFSQNDDALSSVAGAVGEINTRLGYTGDTLSEVTGQFLDFADITGQEVVGSVQLVTKVMNKWGEDASKLPSVLDDLAYAGQISGLSVTTLSNTLITGASSLQEMGLSLENAIGLLAKMELYGVEGTSTITAMRTAVKNFAADGLDAQEALQDTITEIANMKDSSEATTKAVEVFGSKVGVDFARAIRDGAITTDTLTGSLDEAAGTLERTAAAGESLSEKWEKANNKMTVAFTQTLEPTIHDASAELAELWGNVGDFLSEHPNVVKALTAVGAGLGAVAVGVAGVSASFIFASTTVKAFATAMMPFAPGLLTAAAAVTAVTAAVTMLGNKYEDTYDEAVSMTATTAAQTKELESLKEQYDKACRTYGSTSDQASTLKYRIDELSDSLENNGQSVDEYVSNLDSVISKHNDLIDSFGSNTQAIHNSEVENLALVAQLDALASSTGNSAEKQAQMETIINELNGSIDGLNLTYEDLTENQSKAIASVKEMAKQQAEQELQKEKYQEYVDLLKQQATEQETIKENNDAIAAAQERVNEAQKVYDDYIADLYAQDPTGMATISAQWSEQAANLNAANEELQKYQDKQGELQKALDDTSDRLEVIDRYYTQQAEDAKAAGSEIVSQQEAVLQAYNDVRADVEKLCEAYDAAYKAAKDSFEGQFGLFDEASTKSEDYLNASVAAAQAALDSQLNYWNTYTANIETLKGTSYQDLGITEDNYKALMSYVQDGSEQAAGLAASMVKAINSGNKDAVSKLANTLADVTAKQDEAAQATADWVTGYEKQLDEFERKMLDTVEGMDMSLNAKAQAEKTLDGYIQGIKNGKKDAVAAAKDVAASVAVALQNSSTYTPTTPTPTVQGHANGTTDAEDVFIAGEEGPELIVGKQGSTVFPTEETEKIIDALNGIDDAPATATAAPASETTYNTVTDDHSVVDSHDVANEYAITDSHAVTDSHDLTDASVLNDSHDVTSIDNSAQTVDSHDVAESYTTDNSVESHITQEQAGTEKRFSQFLQALAGISIDAPEPAPGESLLASTLGKVADILSGKNSDLPEIEAAYMGLTATPQGGTETYDLTELEDVLTQQPTAPVAADEQQATATAVPASETPEPVEPAPLNVLPVATAPQSAQNAPAETVKRVILELVGKGTVTVSGGSGGGMTESDVLELLTDNMKPVLMGIIKQEIFEEGQLSYEY